MLYGICSIVILCLGTWTPESPTKPQKPVWPQKDPALRRVPVLPRDLETALLPTQLAHARVSVEQISAALVRIEAKFGENAPETKFYRKQLTTARDELEQFERAIDDSTDPGLRAEAEKACEKALSRYRKRLTMTKEELAATRKLEREESDRVMAELLKRRRELDDKPPERK